MSEAEADLVRPVPPRIDAHHHLWDLSVRDQAWTAELPVLRRSFTMVDLTPELASAGVDRTVLVQTVTDAAETPELLRIAADHDSVAAVVGWVDLTAADVADSLAALREAAGGEFLKGIRHQVQGENDPRWLLRPDVLRGLAAVAQAGLVYDFVVTHEQLPAAVEVVGRLDGLRWVLDHAGKPPIAAGQLDPWRGHLRALARNERVACKLSGLVTEAGSEWSFEQLAPYAAHVLEVFGPDRVMVGSDWPVCLLRASYGEVDAINRRFIADLNLSEQQAALGGTAAAWYGLG